MNKMDTPNSLSSTAGQSRKRADPLLSHPLLIHTLKHAFNCITWRITRFAIKSIVNLSFTQFIRSFK